MSIQGSTDAGRRAAEARMLDDFTIMQPTGGHVFNGVTDVVPLVTLFTTRGRVKVVSNLARTSEVGGRTSVEVSRELHIPTCSPVTPVGAIAVPGFVDDSTDPTLVGALRIDGPTPGSQTTARRLQVSEVLK